MITESNFFDYKGDKGVAISRTCPSWWKGKKYPLLAPSSRLLNLWKGGYIEEEAYIRIYIQETLKHIDKEKVKEELGEDAVLLCWEKTGFCHRHIVIKWLNEK